MSCRHVGATIEHAPYIQANGRTVATVHRAGTNTTNTTRYLHKDHLGSVVAITSETGTIVESLAYDAWGKRRPATTWQTPAPGVFIAAINVTRGFTMVSVMPWRPPKFPQVWPPENPPLLA